MGDLILHLYGNDYSPVKYSLTSDFREIISNDYSPRLMWGQMWKKKNGFLTNQEVFEFTEWTGKVYGYYVTGRGQLVFSERFDDDDAPYKVSRKGDRIDIIIGLNLITGEENDRAGNND